MADKKKKKKGSLFSVFTAAERIKERKRRNELALIESASTPAEKARLAKELIKKKKKK